MCKTKENVKVLNFGDALSTVETETMNISNYKSSWLNWNISSAQGKIFIFLFPRIFPFAVVVVFAGCAYFPRNGVNHIAHWFNTH